MSNKKSETALLICMIIIIVGWGDNTEKIKEALEAKNQILVGKEIIEEKNISKIKSEDCFVCDSRGIV